MMSPKGLLNEQFGYIAFLYRQKKGESVLINQFGSLLWVGYLFLDKMDF